MRNITKLNILFLLISFMLSGCNRTQCIEADDFGFASVTVSARYPNNSSTKYINNYQNKDMGVWLDTGYFLTGAPLTIMVSNWKWNRNLGITSNNTGSSLSAWSPWFGSAKYYNYLPASIVNLRSCIFGSSNSTTCFADGTPDAYRIANAPCLMTQGVGLYGLIQAPGATSPNTSVTSQASPSGYSFHVGAKENNAALFDASGAAGGIVVYNPKYQDISNYTGGKLFLKILDVNYGDNAGQYIVKIKSGVRNLGADPFKAFADKFQQIIFAGNGTTPGIVPTIYGNILTQTGFLKAVKAILTLYIFFTGAGFLIGIVQFTAWEVLNRVIKILIIGALLSPNSWSYFSSYLFNIFMYGSNQIIGMIEYAATGGYTSGGESIMALLFAEETIAKLSSIIWMDFTGIMYFIMFVFLILLVTYIYLKAWIFFITAFLFVGVMLSLTPIFLCFMLFGWTNHLYKGWVDKLIAYSMQPIILFAALAFLGSMIRSEIYNTLGFKVCLHNVFNMTITENPYSLLKMYYPEPITLGATQNIAVPKPWTRSNGQQCRAYECQDNRYLQLPYLDPNSPEDVARINAFASGTHIHLDALVYLIITAIIMLFFNDSALAIATGIFGGGLSATAANAAAKGAAKYAWDASKYVGGKVGSLAMSQLRGAPGKALSNLQGMANFAGRAGGQGKIGDKISDSIGKFSDRVKKEGLKEVLDGNSKTNIQNKMSAATKKRVDAKIALDEAKARQAKFTGSQDPSKQNKLSGLFQKSPDDQIAKLQKDFDKAQKSEMGIINKLKTSNEIGQDLKDQKDKLVKLVSESKNTDEINITRQKIEILLKDQTKAQKREEWANKTTSQKILGNEGAANLAARNQKTADSFAKLKADSGALNNKIARAFGKGKTSEELGKELDQASNKLNVYKTGQEVSKLLENAKMLQNDLNSTKQRTSLSYLNKDIAGLEGRMMGRSGFRNFISGDTSRLKKATSEAGRLSAEIDQHKKGDKYRDEKVALLSETWAVINKGQDILGANRKLAGQVHNDKTISKAQAEVARLEKAFGSVKKLEGARQDASDKRTAQKEAKVSKATEAREKRESVRQDKLNAVLGVQSSTEKVVVQTRIAESVRDQVKLTAALENANNKKFWVAEKPRQWLNNRNIKSLEAKLEKYPDKQGAILKQVSPGDEGQVKELMESTRVDAVKQFNKSAVSDVQRVVKEKASISGQLNATDKRIEKLESEVSKLRDNIIDNKAGQASSSRFKSAISTLTKELNEGRLQSKINQLDAAKKSVTKLEAKYDKADAKESRLVKLDIDEVYRAQHKAQMAQDPKKPDIIDHQIAKATSAVSQGRTELYEGLTRRGHTADTRMTKILKENYDRAVANEQKVLKSLADQGIDVASRLGGGAQDKLQQRMIQDEAKVSAKREGIEKQLDSNKDKLEKARDILETRNDGKSIVENVQNAQREIAALEKKLKVGGGKSDKKEPIQDILKAIDSRKEFLAEPENQVIARFLADNKGANGPKDNKISEAQEKVLKLEQRQMKLEGHKDKADSFTKGIAAFKELTGDEKPSSQTLDKDSGSKKKEDKDES